MSALPNIEVRFPLLASTRMYVNSAGTKGGFLFYYLRVTHKSLYREIVCFTGKLISLAMVSKWMETYPKCAGAPARQRASCYLRHCSLGTWCAPVEHTFQYQNQIIFPGSTFSLLKKRFPRGHELLAQPMSCVQAFWSHKPPRCRY